jgi:DNA-binding MarR family transcriptional regulator
MKNDIDTLLSVSMQLQKIMSQQGGVSADESPATTLQFYVLSFLEKYPNSKLSEVADYLQASRSSTTQLIERMNKAGFISRKIGEKDKRETQLSLTDQGINKLNEINKVKQKSIEKIIKRIPEKDIEELIRIQEALLESLKLNPEI